MDLVNQNTSFFSNVVSGGAPAPAPVPSPTNNNLYALPEEEPSVPKGYFEAIDKSGNQFTVIAPKGVILPFVKGDKIVTQVSNPSKGAPYSNKTYTVSYVSGDSYLSDNYNNRSFNKFGVWIEEGFPSSEKIVFSQNGFNVYLKKKEIQTTTSDNNNTDTTNTDTTTTKTDTIINKIGDNLKDQAAIVRKLSYKDMAIYGGIGLFIAILVYKLLKRK